MSEQDRVPRRRGGLSGWRGARSPSEDRAQSPAREAARAGRERVKRELLAETNGPHTTSELLFFWSYELRVLSFELPVPGFKPTRDFCPTTETQIPSRISIRGNPCLSVAENFCA